MGGAEAQGIPRLVPVHWWAELGVPEFVFLPTGGWGRGPGYPGTVAYPPVGEAGSGASAAHWCACLGPGPSGEQGWVPG